MKLTILLSATLATLSLSAPIAPQRKSFLPSLGNGTEITPPSPITARQGLGR